MQIRNTICTDYSYGGQYKTDAGRGTVNFKIVSATIFILLLISHLIFGFTAVRPAPYVIINGILILIYAIIEYGIVKSDS